MSVVALFVFVGLVAYAHVTRCDVQAPGDIHRHLERTDPVGAVRVAYEPE